MNNIFKNSKAFTLAEISVVMIVIGVILTLTICNTINTDEYKEKHLKSKTRVFYSDVESAYQSVLTYDTDGFNIMNLKDTDNSSAVARSEKIRELFADDMNLEYISCDEISSLASIIGEENTDARCALSNKGFYVIFDVLNNCRSQKCYKYEFYKDDPNEIGSAETYETDTAPSEDTCCGHIIYLDKTRSDITPANDVGRYLFYIPLGKKGIKYL